MPAETRRGDMIYRALGRTGETVSLVGLGGSPIGQAETRMGKALRDGYRQKVFLTDQDRRAHQREAAAKQIDESLKRLQTDHVDLLQYHEVIRRENPDRIFATGGAHEAFADARRCPARLSFRRGAASFERDGLYLLQLRPSSEAARAERRYRGADDEAVGR
jgi:aryl-alcohol dehydrogenase-like predicted oxidoreductase